MWILLESISVDTPEKKIIEMENSIILNYLTPPMVILKKKKSRRYFRWLDVCWLFKTSGLWSLDWGGPGQQVAGGALEDLKDWRFLTEPSHWWLTQTPRSLPTSDLGGLCGRNQWIKVLNFLLIKLSEHFHHCQDEKRFSKNPYFLLEVRTGWWWWSIKRLNLINRYQILFSNTIL